MFAENQMATNIVKWMKTKFNGYKQFTVMPNELGDGRLSDTEVLLKPANFLSQETNVPFVQSSQSRFINTSDAPRIVSPSSLPTAHVTFHDNTKLSSAKRHLNLEELECDVSVEGCAGDKNNGQRQEFSFTLYDLDGHGKITKDDIAGLVKTIYETLGQSIKVPHYGSKTIKVKLTVSPEKKNNAKSANEQTCSVVDHSLEKSQQPSSGSNQEKDCNRCRKDGTTNNNGNCRYHREKRHKQYHQLHDHRTRRRHSISSSGAGAAEAFSEDREADVSENEQDDQPSPNNRRLQNPAFITNTSPIYSRYKKRSSSLQRQELLQIIQANMEKNNLCFHTVRKPNTVCTVHNELHDLPQNHHRNKSKHTSHSNDCSPGGCRTNMNNTGNKYVKTFPSCIVDSNNNTFYVQHSTPNNNNNNNINNNNNNVMTGDNNRNTATTSRQLHGSRNDYHHHHHHKRIHHRSRSYDLPNCRYSFSEEKRQHNNVNDNNNSNKTTPITRRELAPEMERSVGKTATRDQVVKWLEQEFYSLEGKHQHYHYRHRKETKPHSSPLVETSNKCDEVKKNISNHSNNNNNNGNPSRRAYSSHHQDRQEHHHVHEHVHHHYHHYRDSMPIVV